MQFKRATLVLLVLMCITTTVAPRKLLANEFALSNTLDFATEHQRILAELEEVHQLRERMLQQAVASSQTVLLEMAHCHLYFIVRGARTRTRTSFFFFFQSFSIIWGSWHIRVRVRGRDRHRGAPSTTPSHWQQQQWRSGHVFLTSSVCAPQTPHTGLRTLHIRPEGYVHRKTQKDLIGQRAQRAQQLQEHQMRDPVPAAVVALAQASSAPPQTSYSSLFHLKLKLQQNGIFVCWQKRDVCNGQNSDAGAGSKHVSVQGHVC
ncbi:MAG: hypothetical protein FRX49_10024 [Trebouxia sp. A1-2]|nr:MAG: hypothetical protein FRX49_10024 [Trebouxia sp. A1-2]